MDPTMGFAGTTAAAVATPSNFTYHPRSQQQALFPHEDELASRDWRTISGGGNSLEAGGLMGSSLGETAQVSGSNNEENEVDSIQTIDFSPDDDESDDEEETSEDEDYRQQGNNVLRNSNQGDALGENPFAPALGLASYEQQGLRNLGETAAEALAAVVPPARAPRSRARRQAAISCLERISTAIATDGMGVYRNDDEDEMPPLDDNEDCKPSAKAPTMCNSIRKRCQPPKSPPAKKRKCEGGVSKSVEDDAPATCCICLEVPTKEDLASISGCSHPFCFGCIEKWADRENTCPLCKSRFNKIEKVHGPNSSEKTKKVTNRNQRSDINAIMGSMDGFFGEFDRSVEAYFGLLRPSLIL
jgi:hypothetical protein